MGFCPFLSFKISVPGSAIIDQGGVEYERDTADVFKDSSANTISDNAPTVMAGVATGGTPEIEKLIDVDGEEYLPDASGVFRDGSNKTAAQNEAELASAETEHSSYGFFRCPEDVSCKLWDPANEICGVFDASGSGSSGGGVPKAAMLLNEYMGGEDLDGNGAVYGKHFYITASERPPMLATMPETGTEWTWQQYLDSL